MAKEIIRLRLTFRAIRGRSLIAIPTRLIIIGVMMKIAISLIIQCITLHQISPLEIAIE